MIGNSADPQPHFALGRAIGFGLIIASSLTSTNTGFAQEYQHGTHATAIYAAEGLKSRIIAAVKGGVPVNAVKVTAAAPQAYDFTLPAQIFAPVVNQQAGAVGSQYTFGLHAQQIADSQNRSVIIRSAVTPPSSTTYRPLQTITVPPQAYDFTLKASLPFVPVPTGWISTQIGAGPQLADLTLPASVQKSVIHLALSPWNPTTIVSKSQADPTQIAPQIFAPAPVKVAPQQISPVFAAPVDPTQLQPRIFPAVVTPPKPGPYVQPVLVTVAEQTYQNIPWIAFTQPVVGSFIPPPLPGFRVMAVTAGYYGNAFRTPGDVFDIAFAADFSDSSVDYQDTDTTLTLLNGGGALTLLNGQPFQMLAGTLGSTTGFGWMVKVSPNTPLFNWLEANNAPYLPPQDPLRRFIY